MWCDIVTADSFVPMKCPRCVQRIHGGAESCPHCGFSIADVDARYGAGRVKVSSLDDESGLLDRSGRAEVRAAMARIPRKFPQLVAAVHLGPVGAATELRQFAFWLINRAVIEDIPKGRNNDACVLLVLDPRSRMATMVHGYLLDGHLREEDSFECLARAHGYWLEGRYAEGIVKAWNHLEGILIRRSRQARRAMARHRHSAGVGPSLNSQPRPDVS